MVSRIQEFPTWNPAEHVPATSWSSDGVLRLRHELPAMVTPWVRVVDYSLPGYLETEVPESWAAGITQWEQGLLRQAMLVPVPRGGETSTAWPASAAEWKRRHRPWCTPAGRADRWKGRWRADRCVPVYVGTARQPRPAGEVLAPGQWVKLKFRLEGWGWDGDSGALALVCEQILVRQPWEDDVREMAVRAIESARAAHLIGPKEEKILSLLDISSG